MNWPHAAAARRPQRGGFAMGLIVGLLIGLAMALAVALYIAKVPVPFVDKVPHRTAEQEAAEAERLKGWDPNAGLGGKPAAAPPAGLRPLAGAAAPAATASAPVAVAASAPARAASKAVAAASAAEGSALTRPVRDPAALLAGQPVPGDKASATPKADPKGDPFMYFVQAGAYSNADDAEQQRAKLAIQGITARVSEREQGGRVVHRVRLGPFDQKDEAETQQERLRAAGAEAVLVRVEKPRPGAPG